MGNTIGNSIGNTTGNTIGNAIGNTIGNSIGNTTGNSIKKSDFHDTPFEDVLIFLKMFMKKGYCHIDGKVCTINFCGGSERVCGTFADW